MIFYTADENYNHRNIITHCNRPFNSVEEMTEKLIENHNNKVKNDNDFTVHAGNFYFTKEEEEVHELLGRLRGKHIIVRGNHDYWMPKYVPHKGIYVDSMFEHSPVSKRQLVVVTHYAMRVWNKSHYNSWNLYGHSHGILPPIGKQYDVGVDSNNYTPVSYEEIVEIMKKQPDNYGYRCTN